MSGKSVIAIGIAGVGALTAAAASGRVPFVMILPRRRSHPSDPTGRVGELSTEEACREGSKRLQFYSEKLHAGGSLSRLEWQDLLWWMWYFPRNCAGSPELVA